MRIWKYGDDINTDMLFPGKYTYSCSTAEEIRPHLLEDLDPDFADNVKTGDLILAGRNFGCGSSREHPVIGIKASGVIGIVARSFARIFYRSAINQGLLLIECSEAADAYVDGDEVRLDASAGWIEIKGKRCYFPKLPPNILAIMEAGGLLPYTVNSLKNDR